jgi:hypothetical protein
MTEQRKRFWTLTGIAAVIAAIGTTIAALANITNNKINENELVTKSIYSIIENQIPALRERVAVLEDRCKQPSSYPVFVSMHGCSSDNDCNQGFVCAHSDCVKATALAKPETFPSFENIQKYVQKTGKSWDKGPKGE